MATANKFTKVSVLMSMEPREADSLEGAISRVIKEHVDDYSPETIHDLAQILRALRSTQHGPSIAR